MSRLIDADFLKENLLNRLSVRSEEYLLAQEKFMWKVINEQPTVDAEPVRHGHWIDCKGSDGKDYRKCSKCLHTQNITGLLNYCPICGAKMDGEE